MAQQGTRIQAASHRMAEAMRMTALRGEFVRSAMAPKAGQILRHFDPLQVQPLERAEMLMQGIFSFAGHRIESPDHTPWGIAVPSLAFEEALHSFQWLEDLAADGRGPARVLAHIWIEDWIERHAGGRLRHWMPGQTGQRVMRLIAHAPFWQKNISPALEADILALLGRSVSYLQNSAVHTAAGLPRFQALAGALIGALALEGFQKSIPDAVAALGAETSHIDNDGGIPSRNPEELLHIFSLLVWCLQALDHSDKAADMRILDAVERIAPALRALRLSDGGLVRMQGGGRGPDGLLDLALSESGLRPGPKVEHAMGYQSITAGRSSVVIDAAPPAAGPSSLSAHASTLAVEFSSARRRIFTACGAGDIFGWRWRNACRDTDAHSALVVSGDSSAKIAHGNALEGQIISRCSDIDLERVSDTDGHWLSASHDGYLAEFGLVHQRRLYLSRDGRDFRGEDRLEPGQTRQAKSRFTRARRGGVVAIHVRFHLHPDAKPERIGDVIDITLPGAEVWRFEHDQGELSLEDSIYLDQRTQTAHPTQQITLFAALAEPSAKINWALSRIDTNTRNTRDLLAEPLYDPAAKPIPAPPI